MLGRVQIAKVHELLGVEEFITMSKRMKKSNIVV